MQLPAPFGDEFLSDILYSPEVLFLDRIEAIDASASRIVCRMRTDGPMPFTDHQVADPIRHPRHVAGAVMIQVTGNLGFAHLFYLEGLRHRDGWVGYGTHIHKAVFRKLVPKGMPMICSCTQTKVRRGKARMFSTYRFEFHHDGDLAFESEQNAMWINVTERAKGSAL